MENPACWNKVEKTICEALTEFDDSLKQGVIGNSLVRVIYNKLKACDMLKELHEGTEESETS